ncbi:holdfast anchor protein HfaD [Asticcacaulis machinosus]|uniref:Holdfast anchor protein HfaD n=1 Tax=Asticcacaulis machinosus TaxID=2984211 RepID=A0ABT5HND7_9CAUL|nr:holdfast anchor protein HfaD [Asticcacaulis machinosus]MDC7677763.1 holdfast anchor protein HfaD [Asticcacaulis machinosus]
MRPSLITIMTSVMAISAAAWSPATSQDYNVTVPDADATQAACPLTNGMRACTNTQSNTGAVTSAQTANVYINDGLTSLRTYATGNRMDGGNAQVNATLNSVQTNSGVIEASTRLNSTAVAGETGKSIGTPVYMETQGIGNSGSFAAVQGELTTTINQTSTANHVYADSEIAAPNGTIYSSGEVQTTAIVNHQEFGATEARIVSNTTQASNTDVRARTTTSVQYSPSPNLYASNAYNNYFQANGDDRGSQLHQVTQTTSAATRTEAYSDASGTNLWNVAGTANAVANTVNVGNTGGSMVVRSDQTNANDVVLADTRILATQYGTATATASSTGNLLIAGNNDKYVEIDNSQLNSGGVEASAQFTGQDGYDTYLQSDATGNSAMGYACGACEPNMSVNNNQVNNGDVTATNTVNITGTGRSIVSVARATGNTATYYTSGNP